MKKMYWLALALLLCTAPAWSQNWWGNGIKGTGPVVKKTLDLANFSGFELAVAGDVYLRKGTKAAVTIEGQENILAEIVTKVEDGFWRIRFNRAVSYREPLKIYITLPSITVVKLSGSGDIHGQSEFTNLNALTVAISGSGNINLKVGTKALDASISGSGDLTLEGTTQDFDLRISGSGDFMGKNLTTTAANIGISGSGNASIYATEQLDIRVSGSGDVGYRGRPRISSKVSGSGDVYSLKD